MRTKLTVPRGAPEGRVTAHLHYWSPLARAAAAAAQSNRAPSHWSSKGTAGANPGQCDAWRASSYLPFQRQCPSRSKRTCKISQLQPVCSITIALRRGVSHRESGAVGACPRCRFRGFVDRRSLARLWGVISAACGIQAAWRFPTDANRSIDRASVPSSQHLPQNGCMELQDQVKVAGFREMWQPVYSKYKAFF